MRRKALAILLSTACVLLTVACGAAGSETAGQTEEAAAEETATAQEADSQGAEAAESADDQGAEGAQDAESAETDGSKEEETDGNSIIWYMDEDGIKSDELGMMISRNNGIMDVELAQHMMVWGGGTGTQLNFTCSYYDGSLNNYIVQNADYKKGTWGEYEYAYQEDLNDNARVAFVGNGMVLEGRYYVSDRLEGEGRDEYLTRANIQACDEFAQDCLAYLTADGLYCPALGLSITYNEDGTSEYGENEIDSQYVTCSNYDLSRSLEIRSDSYQNNTSYYGMGEAESAQEALEIYVASCMEPSEYKTVEHTELDGIEETTIAGHPYLGRGLSSRSMDGIGSMDYEWLFCSDDIAWTIWIDTEEETYESCLSVIEVMP